MNFIFFFFDNSIFIFNIYTYLYISEVYITNKISKEIKPYCRLDKIKKGKGRNTHTDTCIYIYIRMCVYEEEERREVKTHLFTTIHSLFLLFSYSIDDTR